MNTHFLIQADKSSRILLRQMHLNKSILSDYRWLYLGRNFRLHHNWQKALLKLNTEINYGKRLQEIGMELRQEYLKYIKDLGKKNPSLSWWASRNAEVNTLQDNCVFHGICYAKVALERLEQPLVIIAESPALLQTIQQYAPEAKTIYNCTPKNVAFNLLKWLRKAIVFFILNLRNGWRDMHDVRLSRPKNFSGSFAVEKKVLIHSCFDEKSFETEGNLHDRYFCDLPQKLWKLGCHVTQLVWIFKTQETLQQTFAKLHQHKNNFLIPEDFYKITDYVWSGIQTLKQVFLPKGILPLSGISPAKIMQECCFEQSVRLDTAKFLRYFCLFKRLRKAGISFDYYLDKFENFLPERISNLAMHQEMPKTITVGFQHFISPYPFLLGHFNTSNTKEFCPLPKAIVCNSDFTKNIFIQEGFLAECLKTGPSLRYQHVLNSNSDANLAKRGRKILVLLSMNSNITAECLSMLFKTFANESDIYFYLKPHPMMLDSILQQCLSEHPIPKNMGFVNGNMDVWLPQVACAIICESTAALEILLSSVPVIQLAQETEFEMDSLWWFKEFPPPVRTTAELRKQVLFILNNASAEEVRMQKWIKKWRDICLSPVNNTTLSVFVENNITN